MSIKGYEVTFRGAAKGEVWRREGQWCWRRQGGIATYPARSGLVRVLTDIRKLYGGERQDVKLEPKDLL